jgi:hypothetical protein
MDVQLQATSDEIVWRFEETFQRKKEKKIFLVKSQDTQTRGPAANTQHGDNMTQYYGKFS